jgi:hypothetical protein
MNGTGGKTLAPIWFFPASAARLRPYFVEKMQAWYNHRRR